MPDNLWKHDPIEAKEVQERMYDQLEEQESMTVKERWDAFLGTDLTVFGSTKDDADCFEDGQPSFWTTKFQATRGAIMRHDQFIDGEVKDATFTPGGNPERHDWVVAKIVDGVSDNLACFLIRLPHHEVEWFKKHLDQMIREDYARLLESSKMT